MGAFAEVRAGHSVHNLTWHKTKEALANAGYAAVVIYIGLSVCLAYIGAILTLAGIPLIGLYEVVKHAALTR